LQLSDACAVLVGDRRGRPREVAKNKEEAAMAMTQQAEKPAYLDLLNAISLGESHAGKYLEAWADVTPDEDLACTLRLVAARETSHGDIFCRRIAELGFQLTPKKDPKAGENMAKYADPRISDIEKIGPEREPVDFFGEIKQKMSDGAYDEMTCNLLQWYIAEEEDSLRRLGEAYDAVRDRASGRRPKARAGADAGPSADAEAMMACMTQGFGRLEKSLEKLAKAVS
jgi:rubrerythrin